MCVVDVRSAVTVPIHAACYISSTLPALSSLHSHYLLLHTPYLLHTYITRATLMKRRRKRTWNCSSTASLVATRSGREMPSNTWRNASLRYAAPTYATLYSQLTQSLLLQILCNSHCTRLYLLAFATVKFEEQFHN